MKMFSIKNRHIEMERLIAAERPRLLQYACYRLGSQADAEDAVQDTLASLHQRFHAAESRGHTCLDYAEAGKRSDEIQRKQEEDFTINNLTAYLFRSLSNRCVSYQRENNRLHLIPLDCQTDPADFESENFEQEYQRISQLLAEIPDEQAEVIRLRYYGDKTFKEIAQILDEPITTVKSRFVYGLEKIKRGMRALSDNV